jgi:hypothetical protein
MTYTQFAPYVYAEEVSNFRCSIRPTPRSTMGDRMGLIPAKSNLETVIRSEKNLPSLLLEISIPRKVNTSESFLLCSAGRLGFHILARDKNLPFDGKREFLATTFEHNNGLGKKILSTLYVTLMMFALFRGLDSADLAILFFQRSLER